METKYSVSSLEPSRVALWKTPNNEDMKPRGHPDHLQRLPKGLRTLTIRYAYGVGSQLWQQLDGILIWKAMCRNQKSGSVSSQKSATLRLDLHCNYLKVCSHLITKEENKCLLSSR